MYGNRLRAADSVKNHLLLDLRAKSDDDDDIDDREKLLDLRSPLILIDTSACDAFEEGGYSTFL